MNTKCSKCGSGKIVPLAHMLDQGQASDGALKASVFTKPDALIFKGPVCAKVKANVCGECGYTELIAENPGALYEAYLKVKSL